MTHYKYAMRGLSQEPSASDQDVQGQTADTPVATKKTKDTEHAKAPVKNSDPYKKDPSEAEQMEARYQELLKKYKIIE